MIDAVFTTDLGGRVVQLNQQATDWSGRPAAAVIGCAADEVFPLWTELGQPIARPTPTGSALLERALASTELTVHLPRGEPIPVQRVVSPIRDERGETVGAVEVLRDLRAQREVEQLKANIISLVSHELRTPLSHIKGYASSLLQPDVTWDTDTQRDFIASIERQADRLARLIGDLLEISHLDAGGSARLERVPVRPALLVDRGVREARPTLGRHPLVTVVPEDLPLVLADVNHAERVLTNLLENAAKYSPEEAPVQVTVEAQERTVLFAVHDEGSGLTDEDQCHLFERFYRSPRVKHRTPGTGLGLAICREIVVAHGGQIWAESTVGQGSVFHFTLPRAERMER
jgi:PAS domain S-box-containing protein